jgi:hypothetical protein
MSPRRQQVEPHRRSLSEEAEKLRKEARGTPPGVEGDRLLKRARQADSASRPSERQSTPAKQDSGPGSLDGQEQSRELGTIRLKEKRAAFARPQGDCAIYIDQE